MLLTLMRGISALICELVELCDVVTEHILCLAKLHKFMLSIWLGGPPRVIDVRTLIIGKTAIYLIIVRVFLNLNCRFVVQKVKIIRNSASLLVFSVSL